MKRIPDRKKLRREYLRKKGETYANIVIYFLILFVPVIALYMFFKCDSGTRVRIGIFAALTWIIFAPIYELLWYLFWCAIVELSKELNKAKQIPYVPPITPSTLSAEEVLVRGAEEPSAPSETLLRATVKGKATKREELLRAKL